MRALARLLGIAFVALLATSCMTPVGAGPFGHVPLDAPGKCADYCSKMGLTLGAVVVMAGNVGCVCTPVHAGGSSARDTAPAAAGGMVAILLQQQAQAQQQQQQQQQRSSSH
jgi:hypothetical protein